MTSGRVGNGVSARACSPATAISSALSLREGKGSLLRMINESSSVGASVNGWSGQSPRSATRRDWPNVDQRVPLNDVEALVEVHSRITVRWRQDHLLGKP